MRITHVRDACVGADALGNPLALRRVRPYPDGVAVLRLYLPLPIPLHILRGSLTRPPNIL